VTAMAKVEKQISTTRHGPYLLRRLGVTQFQQDPEQWANRVQVAVDVKADFAATFGGAEDEAGAGAEEEDGYGARRKRKKEEEAAAAAAAGAGAGDGNGDDEPAKKKEKKEKKSDKKEKKEKKSKK
jgi:nucleolar protein 9